MTVVCAVLVAVWLVLPWHPSASRRRKLLALALLGAATVMLFASDLIWALGLYPIVFADAVFLFSYGAGVAYAAATLFALSSPPLSDPSPVAWARRRRLSSRGGR